MNEVIELRTMDSLEYCLFNIKTNKIVFMGQLNSLIGKKNSIFTGYYYKEGKLFFAMYPTKSQVMIYFNNQHLPLTKKLKIKWSMNDDDRRFEIEDYNIVVEYQKSKWIGWDIWSDEIDVDLFCLIAKKYKTDEFYQRYTSDLEYDLSKEFNDLIKKQ